ncbi:hypothetical protein ONA02_00580 [Mycoplasmopsis felis]|nr:hypothetical protein [Mycoplasmopsis felis]WAM02381.1 hypothetical protein ONA02_00580 [Mycoplasmopsis felis]
MVFESEYKLSFLLKNFPNFPDDKLNVNQFVLNENKTPVRIRKNELGIILEYENLFQQQNINLLNLVYLILD